MAIRANLANQRFSRLIVESYFQSDHRGSAIWRCVCDCGCVTYVKTYKLKSGSTKSCGCYNRDKSTKHGLSKRHGYFIWRGMLSRCYQVGAKDWENYGSRGIRITQEWLDNPQLFLDWYDNQPNAGQKGYSLDRIDNDGPYSPENCRITTVNIQNWNRRKPHDMQIKLDAANAKIQELEAKLVQLQYCVVAQSGI